jgi:hypothetical protein
MRHFAGVVMACFLMIGLAPGPGRTQTPSPEAGNVAAAVQRQSADKLFLAAIGDSLGDGLWEGLYRRLHGDERFVVFRGARHSVGFTGSDMTEQIDAAFAAGPVDALVIMIGANDDRRSFFINGKSQALFGSPKWVDLYRGRIENFMDYAGRRSVPLLWVLLPVMRSPEATVAAALTNGIITQAAQSRPHVTVIPIWAITADETGAYMAYFKDLKGKKRLMRHADGLHFTEPGYELLSHITFNRLLEVSPRFRAVVPDAPETAVVH